jgi:SNF2 family DNA or RNA helicase
VGTEPDAEGLVTQAFRPHPYQQDAMAHIYATRRCALWMPMGGGKTVTTLTALDHLSLLEDVFPVLVLAPLRVARSTWPEEVAKWPHLQHLRVSVISGTPKQRERALAKDADIYCTNYDNLVWLRKALGDAWPFKTVVADEFTRLKSFRLRQGGSRARALGQVAHSHVSRFIGLTGTPAPNGVKDLWGQVWFLDQGERLGRTFSAFEQRWFRKGYDGYSLVPYDHTQAEVEERLKDICLTVTGLDVDEPIVNPIYVDLPPMARKVYDAMEAEMFAVLNDEGVEAANAAVRTQKCLQLANGALYIDDAGNWEEAHAAKLDALESIIEEANGAPVLVAYNFKHDLQRLQARFRQGRVLDADPDTIKQWNAGKIPLLFAHPASAGHGLNLADGGNILAFFGVNWNLEEYLQIIERIGPLRQKQAGYDRPVFVYPILARNTVDDMVMERLATKKTVQEILLHAMRRRHPS